MFQNRKRLSYVFTHIQHSHHLLKMDYIAIRLKEEPFPLTIRDINSRFRSTFIFNCFSGTNIIDCLAMKYKIYRKESLHIANSLIQFGFIYSIDFSVNILKDDGSLYRLQSEEKWPSRSIFPGNIDYAVYLEKRKIQNSKLDNLELMIYDDFRLQFAHQWKFITKQANSIIESEEKLSKDRRLLIVSEEKCFWNIHRPSTEFQNLILGCYSHKRNSLRKNFQISNQSFLFNQNENFGIIRSNTLPKKFSVKFSIVADNIVQYSSNLSLMDPYISKLKNQILLIKQSNILEISVVESWCISFDHLMRSTIGRFYLLKFLETEVSSENIQFWEEVQEYKKLPKSMLAKVSIAIFSQYIDKFTKQPINIDKKTLNLTVEQMFMPDRYTFDPAINHIYELMRKDSYPRFLSSSYYNNLKASCVNKTIQNDINRGEVNDKLNFLDLAVDKGHLRSDCEIDTLVRSNSHDVLDKLIIPPKTPGIICNQDKDFALLKISKYLDVSTDVKCEYFVDNPIIFPELSRSNPELNTFF